MRIDADAFMQVIASNETCPRTVDVGGVEADPKQYALLQILASLSFMACRQIHWSYRKRDRKRALNYSAVNSHIWHFIIAIRQFGHATNAYLNAPFIYCSNINSRWYIIMLCGMCNINVYINVCIKQYHYCVFESKLDINISLSL